MFESLQGDGCRFVMLHTRSKNCSQEKANAFDHPPSQEAHPATDRRTPCRFKKRSRRNAWRFRTQPRSLEEGREDSSNESREDVSVRSPYRPPFTLRNYARLIFAMNNLSPQFFTDAALTKRAAIIEFDRQVLANEKDTDFAEKIIAVELSGVLNWLVDGLGRLIPPIPTGFPKLDKILSGGFRQKNQVLLAARTRRCHFVS